MKRNILILLLSFVTMFATAQEVAVKNTDILTLYCVDYVPNYVKMGYQRYPSMDDKAIMKLRDDVYPIYQEILGDCFKNINKRVGINMRISSKGKILNISISVVKEFADRITKEQFLQFANRIKSTIVTSDYMELKDSSVEQYCTYFWVYENK